MSSSENGLFQKIACFRYPANMDSRMPRISVWIEAKKAIVYAKLQSSIQRSVQRASFGDAGLVLNRLGSVSYGLGGHDISQATGMVNKIE